MWKAEKVETPRAVGTHPPEYATPLDRDTPSPSSPISLKRKDEFALSSWQLIVSFPIKGEGY